jgi:hypothetical protein
MFYGERDEQYVDEWANARVVGSTRYRCTESEGEGHMSFRDRDGGERPHEDECAELQRRLRSGIGSGWNRSLR